MRNVYPELFYGRRQGRPLKATQKELLTNVLPHVLVTLPDEGWLDLSQVFGKKPYTTYGLEIGFGGGEHLAAQAERHPEVGFIGGEAFINGVASLLRLIQDKSLHNVRIFPNDIRQLIRKLPDHALDMIIVLFPDPWPKARHHKRRIINTEMLTEMTRVLRPGGELRIASDHEAYIKWVIAKTLQFPELISQFDSAVIPTTRPASWAPTRYEEKAQRSGRSCYYLSFRYNPSDI